jgi:MFS family permease
MKFSIASLLLFHVYFLFATVIDGKIDGQAKSCVKLKRITREKKVATQILAHNSKVLTSPVIIPQVEKFGNRSKLLSLLLPWLYFMAISINIPNFPKFVNLSMNKGDPNVSPKSAAIYGIMSGTDAFFTFLSVNLVGCMSDSFGRRPFMMISSLGLGIAYLLASSATTPSMFYFGSMIDGLTSCMFSQAQSYIADINSEGNGKQSVAVMLGRFQGVAVGCAFMIGIPLGGILGAKFSPKFTIYVAIGICILNAMLIAVFLPESVPHTSVSDPKRKKIKWVDASPAGAAKMLTRNKKLFVGTLAYFLFNLAQTGVQINWINYLQFRFGWSAAKSGMTMVGVGVTVAFLPQIFM